MEKPNLAISDTDFMAQLLGVSAEVVENRSVNFTEQLQDQLFSELAYRSVERNVQEKEGEHIRPRF